MNTFKVHLQHSGFTIIKSYSYYDIYVTRQYQTAIHTRQSSPTLHVFEHGTAQTMQIQVFPSNSTKSHLLVMMNFCVKIRKELKVQTNTYLEMINHIY